MTDALLRRLTELLPCPFCGKPAQNFSDKGRIGCGWLTCAGFSIITIPEEWNRRAALQAVPQWIAVETATPERDGCYLCRMMLDDDPPCNGIVE